MGWEFSMNSSLGYKWKMHLGAFETLMPRVKSFAGWLLCTESTLKLLAAFCFQAVFRGHRSKTSCLIFSEDSKTYQKIEQLNEFLRSKTLQRNSKVLLWKPFKNTTPKKYHQQELLTRRLRERPNKPAGLEVSWPCVDWAEEAGSDSQCTWGNLLQPSKHIKIIRIS